MEKLKLPPINVQQKRLMVEYIEKYPNLARQKFSADYTFKIAQKHWEELAQILNNIPGGSKKTWSQWRKTWTDLKKNAKNKVSTVQLYTQGTGGGPAVPKEKEITDLEKKILEIIGNVVQRGHENITETPIELNFDNEGDENIVIDLKESGSDESLDRPPSPELDFYLNPIPSTSKGEDKLASIKKTPRQTDEMKDVLPKITKKTISETPAVKLKKPIKCASDGRRLSVTRRLENSQKATADMLKSIESRTSIMEKYYKKKTDYLEHMEKYHKKKLKLQKENNAVLKEILTQAKEIKMCLSRQNESEDE